MSYFDSCVKCEKRFEERSYCFTQCDVCCPKVLCKYCKEKTIKAEGIVCYRCNDMENQAALFLVEAI